MKLNIKKIKKALIDNDLSQSKLSKLTGINWVKTSYIMQGTYFEDLEQLIQPLGFELKDVVKE